MMVGSPYTRWQARSNGVLIEFGIFLDQDGYPSQSRERNIIEWEGEAKQAVLRLPYIILFDSTFVEVRDLEIGGLVQVLTGAGIECIWAESDLPGRVAEMCLHVAIDAERSTFEDVRLEGRIEQRIFELSRISSTFGIPES